MGSGADEPDFQPHEAPIHAAYLSPFLISKYEITQTEWQAVMGSNPSGFRGSPSLPVETVSWGDAQGFCSRLGLALPSVTQWEYACRADTRTAFHVGESLTASDANFGDAIGRTADVGSYPPNQFGLHDMHGNVAEWCADVQHPQFYSSSVALGPDPISTTGPEPDRRMHRGGFWGVRAGRCRSASKSSESESSRRNLLGFRPVLGLKR